MKTQIYKTYLEFMTREDKALNGVSVQFAKVNPGYEQQNETNKACWNCSDCSDCSRCFDCSGCFDCSHCYRCSNCFDCSRCFDCSGCFDCSHCYRCSNCFDCSRCSNCFDCSRCSRYSGIEGGNSKANPLANIPVITAIHQKLLEAVATPNQTLDMSEWHTCDTTHCRAGWIVTLAGIEGKRLERETSTEFAAMQIYKASSSIRVNPARFYDKDAVAMADIRRCAEEEAKQ